MFADVKSSEFFEVVGELSDLVANRLGDQTVVSDAGDFGPQPRERLPFEVGDGRVVEAADDSALGLGRRVPAPEAIPMP